MKIKATNTMAKTIRDYLKKIGFKFEECSLVHFDELHYCWKIGANAARHAVEDGDYDYETGVFSVVRVVYPHDFFSPPAYLSTRRLMDIFKETDGTLDGFLNAVKEDIEI